ncbi:Ankyrin repeat [Diplonema papillatum]|nr:Ankyrin repeat [Diplonema papillatum]
MAGHGQVNEDGHLEPTPQADEQQSIPEPADKSKATPDNEQPAPSTPPSAPHHAGGSTPGSPAVSSLTQATASAWQRLALDFLPTEALLGPVRGVCRSWRRAADALAAARRRPARRRPAGAAVEVRFSDGYREFRYACGARYTGGWLVGRGRSGQGTLRLGGAGWGSTGGRDSNLAAILRALAPLRASDGVAVTVCRGEWEADDFRWGSVALSNGTVVRLDHTFRPPAGGGGGGPVFVVAASHPAPHASTVVGEWRFTRSLAFTGWGRIAGGTPAPPGAGAARLAVFVEGFGVSAGWLAEVPLAAPLYAVRHRLYEAQLSGEVSVALARWVFRVFRADGAAAYSERDMTVAQCLPPYRGQAPLSVLSRSSPVFGWTGAGVCNDRILAVVLQTAPDPASKPAKDPKSPVRRSRRSSRPGGGTPVSPATGCITPPASWEAAQEPKRRWSLKAVARATHLARPRKHPQKLRTDPPAPAGLADHLAAHDALAAAAAANAVNAVASELAPFAAAAAAATRQAIAASAARLREDRALAAERECSEPLAAGFRPKPGNRLVYPRRAPLGVGVPVVGCASATPLGATLLHAACERGAADAADVLVRLGADCCRPDVSGRSPVHVAAKHRHGDAIRVMLRALPREKASAAVRQRDHAGRTPLHLALSCHPSAPSSAEPEWTEEGYPFRVHSMLPLPVKLAGERDNLSPAPSFNLRRRQLKTALLLALYGADPAAPDAAGVRAVALANRAVPCVSHLAKTSDLASLVEVLASVRGRHPPGAAWRQPDAGVLRTFADLRLGDLPCVTGDLPSPPASTRRNVLLAEELTGGAVTMPLAAARVRAADGRAAADELRVTVLHEASGRGDAAVVAALCRCPLVDVDARDRGGRGPLHYAARRGCARTAAVLAAFGADGAAADAAGRTALQLAVRARHADAAGVLAHLVAAARPAAAQAAARAALLDAASLPSMRRKQDTSAAVVRTIFPQLWHVCRPLLPRGDAEHPSNCARDRFARLYTSATQPSHHPPPLHQQAATSGPVEMLTRSLHRSIESSNVPWVARLALSGRRSPGVAGGSRVEAPDGAGAAEFPLIRLLLTCAADDGGGRAAEAEARRLPFYTQVVEAAVKAGNAVVVDWVAAREDCPLAGGDVGPGWGSRLLSTAYAVDSKALFQKLVDFGLNPCRATVRVASPHDVFATRRGSRSRVTLEVGLGVAAAMDPWRRDWSGFFGSHIGTLSSASLRDDEAADRSNGSTNQQQGGNSTGMLSSASPQDDESANLREESNGSTNQHWGNSTGMLSSAFLQGDGAANLREGSNGSTNRQRGGSRTGASLRSGEAANPAERCEGSGNQRENPVLALCLAHRAVSKPRWKGLCRKLAEGARESGVLGAFSALAEKKAAAALCRGPPDSPGSKWLGLRASVFDARKAGDADNTPPRTPLHGPTGDSKSPPDNPDTCPQPQPQPSPAVRRLAASSRQLVQHKAPPEQADAAVVRVMTARVRFLLEGPDAQAADKDAASPQRKPAAALRLANPHRHAQPRPPRETVLSWAAAALPHAVQSKPTFDFILHVLADQPPQAEAASPARSLLSALQRPSAAVLRRKARAQAAALPLDETLLRVIDDDALLVFPFKRHCGLAADCPRGHLPPAPAPAAPGFTTELGLAGKMCPSPKAASASDSAADAYARSVAPRLVTLVGLDWYAFENVSRVVHELCKRRAFDVACAVLERDDHSAPAGASLDDETGGGGVVVQAWGREAEGAGWLSAMHRAAAWGQERLLRLLLRGNAGFRFGEASGAGLTALHYAARNGHVKVLEAFIARGADPFTFAARSATPLHAAAKHGRAEAAAALLDAISGPFAAQAKRRLINLRDAQGATAFFHAASSGTLSCVKALLAAGADPWTPAFGGTSPLLRAAQRNREPVASFIAGGLLQGQPPPPPGLRRAAYVNDATGETLFACASVHNSARLAALAAAVAPACLRLAPRVESDEEDEPAPPPAAAEQPLPAPAAAPGGGGPVQRVGGRLAELWAAAARAAAARPAALGAPFAGLRALAAGCGVGLRGCERRAAEPARLPFACDPSVAAVLDAGGASTGLSLLASALGRTVSRGSKSVGSGSQDAAAGPPCRVVPHRSKSANPEHSMACLAQDATGPLRHTVPHRSKSVNPEHSLTYFAQDAPSLPYPAQDAATGPLRHTLPHRSKSVNPEHSMAGLAQDAATTTAPHLSKSADPEHSMAYPAQDAVAVPLCHAVPHRSEPADPASHPAPDAAAGPAAFSRICGRALRLGDPGAKATGLRFVHALLSRQRGGGPEAAASATAGGVPPPDPPLAESPAGGGTKVWKAGGADSGPSPQRRGRGSWVPPGEAVPVGSSPASIAEALGHHAMAAWLRDKRAEPEADPAGELALAFEDDAGCARLRHDRLVEKKDAGTASQRLVPLYHARLPPPAGLSRYLDSAAPPAPPRPPAKPVADQAWADGYYPCLRRTLRGEVFSGAEGRRGGGDGGDDLYGRRLAGDCFGNKALYAVRRGCLPLLVEAFCRLPDKHLTAASGMTLLTFACHTAAEDIVLFLVSQGLRVNQGTRIRPIECETHAPREVEEDVRGGDPWTTPVTVAALRGDVGVLRVLLAAGGNCDQRDENGNTPVHSACRNRDYACLKALLHVGAAVEVPNFAAETPLHVALALRLANCVKLLQSWVFDGRQSLSDRPPAAEVAGSRVAPIRDLLRWYAAAMDQHQAIDLLNAPPPHRARYFASVEDSVPCLVYRKICQNRGDSPQDAVLQQLKYHTWLDDVRRLDLDGVLLSGLPRVLDVVSRLVNLEALDLSSNGLDPADVRRLCAVAGRHPGLRRVVLNNNKKVGRRGARLLLELLRENRRIIEIECTNASVAAPLRDRLYAEGCRNVREQAGAFSAAARRDVLADCCNLLPALKHAKSPLPTWLP